jgi:cell division protein FtsZ
VIEDEPTNDDEPDVFSSNENRAQVEIMKMSGMEEYDIPAFLRKKGE